MRKKKADSDYAKFMREVDQSNEQETALVCLRSKWGYDHAIRRMSDGTLYELHKKSFTEIQARHLEELAAQEPFLFHEKIFSGELKHGNDH